MFTQWMKLSSEVMLANFEPSVSLACASLNWRGVEKPPKRNRGGW